VTLPDVLPAKRQEVMVADFDTEMVVLVPEVRRSHHLDEGLSLVLDACDGVTSTAAFVAEVSAETGEPLDRVERWLTDALDQLRGLDIVEHG
jgi:hypothetical protein